MQQISGFAPAEPVCSLKMPLQMVHRFCSGGNGGGDAVWCVCLSCVFLELGYKPAVIICIAR